PGSRRGEPSGRSRGGTASAPWLPYLSPLNPRAGALAATLAVVLDVALERARGSELAQLVADHRLGDEHRDVLAAVVHGKGVAQEIRGDHAAARPGLDDVLGARRVLSVHLLLQVVVDEGALLEAARHDSGSLALVLAGAATTDDELVARLVRPASATLGLAPGADGVTTTRRLALTTT